MNRVPLISIENALAQKEVPMHRYSDLVFFTDRIDDLDQYIGVTRQFDVTMVFVCLDGKITCRIDLDRHIVRKGTLLIVFPGQLLTIEASHHASGYASLLSNAFIQESKLENMRLANFLVYVGKEPTCAISAADLDVLEKFHILGRSVLKHINSESRNVARGVAMAFCHTVISCMRANRPSPAKPALKQVAPNHNQIFERFINMVAEHHASERTLAFYAKGLSLSSKYLSLVVKECSGRTVQEWITEYVMHKAKSLLSNSSLSIKEITEALKFRNQSAFGKYFKKHEGISPKAYRNAASGAAKK